MDCLTSLSSSLGFYLVPSSGTYSWVASFSLSCYPYFCVCGRLVMFLNLGEVVLYVLCIPAVHSPLVTQAMCSRGSPLRGLCGPFCCGRLCGPSGKLGWPLLVMGPCLDWKLPKAGWQYQVRKWLAAEPQ